MGAKAQIGIAGLVASIATLIVPLCTSLSYVFGPPVLNADGSPDNAPVRGAAALLCAFPILILVLTVYFTIVPIVLQRLNRLSLRTLAASNILPSLAIAVLFGIQAFHAFGPTASAILFGVFGGSLSIVFLSLGSATWWLMGRPREPTPRVDSPAG